LVKVKTLSHASVATNPMLLNDFNILLCGTHQTGSDAVELAVARQFITRQRHL
jgi:hypothetical protein